MQDRQQSASDANKHSKYRATRRDFMKMGLAVGVSAAAMPSILRAENGLTTDDILGPFHRENAPFRSVLAAPDEPGQRMFMSGTVFGKDGETPLEGAIVDMWQANDEGCYSEFTNLGQFCFPVGQPYNLRGQLLTDAEGKYAFESIVPGKYLNGADFRPRHLHFRIVAPDDPTTLVTQVYFEGDTHIPSDPWASAPKAACRIIPLVEENAAAHGVMNFTIDAALTTDVGDHSTAPDFFMLHQNYPNPCAESTTIRFALPKASHVRLSVYDDVGRELARLIDEYRSAGYHSAGWDLRKANGFRVSNGGYYYTLTATNAGGNHSQMKRLTVIR